MSEMGEQLDKVKNKSLLGRMFAYDGKEHTFYSSEDKLPIHIEPFDFLHWALSLIGEDFEGEPFDYSTSVAGLCEYGVLYICKKAYEEGIDPERMKVCYGDYHISEHYWILLDDEWFVDLTLKQFKTDAPHLAITRKDEVMSETKYNPDHSTMTYMEYLDNFDIF